MSQTKRKPLLNRKETQTLLTTLKMTSIAGAVSLTLAGWGILAQLDATTVQAKVNQETTLVAALPDSNNKFLTSKVSPVSNKLPTSKVLPTPTQTLTSKVSPVSNKLPTSKVLPTPTQTLTTQTLPTPTPTARPVIRLDIVQWVQDVQGDQVAVVRDRRGNYWYVMGSDVPRIEQGLAPEIQPQPVQLRSRSRAS